MLESEVTDFSAPAARSFVFSGLPAPGSKPVFWRAGFVGCFPPGLSSAQSGSVTSQLREWVGSLGKGDERSLSRFGLNLTALQNAAREGRIYGLILTGWRMDQLLSLLDKPSVRSIDVVG
ncbi:hypothetical protein [Microbispora sp. H10836]|uniref:hypothetical protein n=1 Tax=Microbispora sp. H10836 TaxID=2729106 RepID=UPI0014761F75|nr:hypothetical protein [Microbispora sp. H10836]